MTSSKDQVNYRPFTDKPEEEAEKLREELKEQEEDSSREEATAKLGQGFKAFLPGKKSIGDAMDTSSVGTEAKEGVCTYRGKVLIIHH